MTNLLIWFIAPIVYGTVSAGVYSWVRPDVKVTRKIFLLNFVKFTAVAYLILLFLKWLLL